MCLCVSEVPFSIYEGDLHLNGLFVTSRVIDNFTKSGRFREVQKSQPKLCSGKQPPAVWHFTGTYITILTKMYKHYLYVCLRRYNVMDAKNVTAVLGVWVLVSRKSTEDF